MQDFIINLISGTYPHLFFPLTPALIFALSPALTAAFSMHLKNAIRGY